ncbi:MAG TPA: hypothetical protein VN672_09185 [Solirubrobacteraceae bacterium]|nr:hypothetical protein [Solirubrobacteraceae bacterium]
MGDTRNCGIHLLDSTGNHRSYGDDDCRRLSAETRGVPGAMMESENGPLDAATAAALVVRTIEELDDRSCDDSAALLSDLLCAAWPSRWSQDQ